MMQNKSPAFAVTHWRQAVPAGPLACQLELESLVLCVKSLVLCLPATVGSATVTVPTTAAPAQGQGLVSLTPTARPGSRGAGAGLTQAQ